MFERKLPRSCSLAAITTVGVPTVATAVITLLLKSEEIIKVANKLKSGINDIAKMKNEMLQEMNEQASENINNYSEEVN